MTLSLDPTRTRIVIRTFAEGFLSRLAHDLELVCTAVTGSAEARGESAGSARLVIPVAKIEVAGTLKNGVVDSSGLSRSEREDCLEKMRRDVFRVRDTSAAVHVEADLDGGRVRVRVIPPNGTTVEELVPLRPPTKDGSAVRVEGVLGLSLGGIGSAPVRGPMNAFRVKDRVEVAFDLVFVQPA